MAVDPWGVVLADLGGEKRETVVVVDVDLKSVARVRRQMPVMQHRLQVPT